jgi:DNA-binding SARP family transcriptional activator
MRSPALLDGTLLHICLLGKPALLLDGELHAFGGPRRAIALLAYLITHRERALSRAALAERFWPDQDDEDARAALRRHLHRVLSALPPAPDSAPWVIADKTTIRWNAGAPATIDTLEFERLGASGDRAGAIALYRGDFLEEFYDEWIVPERERLRERAASYLAALIDEHRRALDYQSAIGYAQTLLRLDPLREDAIRRLMSLRFAAGDRSGALAEFEAFRKRLREELATEAMPETVALRERIAKNELALDVGEDAAARVTRTHPGFRFVGRDEPLATLTAAWESAARGNATTAIVSGEAGIGKSRLIGELVALAEAQGCRLVFGTTAAIETEPYQAIAEALRGAVGMLALDRLTPVQRAALATLLPEIRERDRGVAELAPLDAPRERQRLFDAVGSAFELLAQRRPLLLVLEDLHAAGAPTIALVDAIVRRLQGKSALIVVSYREDGDARPRLRTLIRGLAHATTIHVALGPLAESDVRAIVAEAGYAGADPAASEIFTAGGGNALFTTELLKARLGDDDGNAIPSGVAAAVRARIERLSPRARTLVDAAAVAGASFDAEVVGGACGWNYADVFGALDEVLDATLVRFSLHRRGDYAFSHQLVRAAVYDAVDANVRPTLHRRIARTLERLYPERPSLCATIARHFDAAGLFAEAATRYATAAQYALDVFAQDEAIALGSRALELEGNPRARFALHALREEAHRRAGDPHARDIDCAAMLELAEEIADDDLRATALTASIAIKRERGDRPSEREAIERLRELGERTHSARRRLEAALAQARMAINVADLAAARSIFAAAEPLVEAVADDGLALEFWLLRVNTAYGTPEAHTFLARARAFVRDSVVRDVRALRSAANIADFEGDAQTLGRVSEELLARNREIGDLDGQASAHLQAALAAWYRLDVAAVHDHNERALAIFERTQKQNSIAAVLNNRGVIAQRLGDFESALADHERAKAIATNINQREYVFLALANFASIAELREDPVRARACANEALAFAHEYGLEHQTFVARAYVGKAEFALGNTPTASEHLEAALLHLRRRDARGAFETLVDLVPVRVALADTAGARAAADELMQTLDRDRFFSKFPARALAAAAAGFAADGQHERAQALATEAATLLTELASRLPDDATKAGYLGLPFHRLILRKVDAAGTIAR